MNILKVMEVCMITDIAFVEVLVLRLVIQIVVAMVLELVQVTLMSVLNVAMFVELAAMVVVLGDVENHVKQHVLKDV